MIYWNLPLWTRLVILRGGVSLSAPPMKFFWRGRLLTWGYGLFWFFLAPPSQEAWEGKVSLSKYEMAKQKVTCNQTLPGGCYGD